MTRCFECLDEFHNGVQRYAVLKKVRDMPPECDPVESRQLESLLYDQVYVCEDCAGWHGDEALKADIHERTE